MTCRCHEAKAKLGTAMLARGRDGPGPTRKKALLGGEQRPGSSDFHSFAG